MRERARELEDKLGDLLHQRMQERFVGKAKRFWEEVRGAA